MSMRTIWVICAHTWLAIAAVNAIAGMPVALVALDVIVAFALFIVARTMDA